MLKHYMGLMKIMFIVLMHHKMDILVITVHIQNCQKQLIYQLIKIRIIMNNINKEIIIKLNISNINDKKIDQYS